MKCATLAFACRKSLAEGLLIMAVSLWAGMTPAGAAKSAIAVTCEGRAASGAASRIDIDDSAVILVATPQLQDPRWQKTVLVAVARSDAPHAPGHFPLARGLVLATGESAVDSIIERDADKARYFMGLVAWRPGELDIELANKLWSVCRADAETVFRADVKRLWNELSAAARRTRVSLPLPTDALAQWIIR